MLFWIFIIVMIGGTVWCVIDSNRCDYGNLPIIPLVAGWLCVLLSLIVMAFNYVNVDGYIEQMNIRHDMLVYQYENDVYENDNDLGKRELMSDIQDWNEDLARQREAQDDLWIGIYVPNIYDQFEFIELE